MTQLYKLYKRTCLPTYLIGTYLIGRKKSMTNTPSSTKQGFLAFMEALLKQGVIDAQDLSRYAKPITSETDPAFVQQELENWYHSLGIESIINRKLMLSQCPFTRDEIEEAYKNNEIILCVPKEVNRQQLAHLFRIETWALYDPLVPYTTEKEDFWFRTSSSLEPVYHNISGIEARHLFDAEAKQPFSLERYLVFIARIRHLTGKTPDYQHWTWLTHRSYDRSGMLIAGFDRNNSFSVHGWMPQFSASFLGARYCYKPDESAGKS